MKHSFVTNLEESLLSRSEIFTHAVAAESSIYGTTGTSYQKEDQLSLTGPTPNQLHQTTAVTEVFMISETGNQAPEHPEYFNALLDSGASRSFVNSNNLVLHEVDDTTPMIWDTMSGSVTTVATKRLRIIPTMIITEQPVEHTWHVANNMGAMDLIIGRDLMQSLGLQMNFASNTLIWEGATLPLTPQCTIQVKALQERPTNHRNMMIREIDHLQRLGILRAVPTDERVNQRTFLRRNTQPDPGKGHDEFVNPKLLTKWLLRQQLQPSRQSRITLRSRQLQPRKRHKPTLRVITDASWHGIGTTTFRGNKLLHAARRRYEFLYSVREQGQRDTSPHAVITLLATVKSLAQQHTVMVMTDSSANLKMVAGHQWLNCSHHQLGLTMRYRQYSSHAPEERLWRRLPMGSDESAAMFARRQPKTNNQRVCYVDDTLLLIADPSTECRDPKENQTSVPLPQMWSGNADLLVDDSIT